MTISNRMMALVFRAVLMFDCLIGLYLTSGLPQGQLSLQMFCFYTILSNVVCLVFFAWLLARTARVLRTDGIRGTVSTPRFKGAITMMITVTMLIYHVLLRPEAFTMGGYTPFTAADVLVHYVTPTLTILDWVLFDKKRRFRWYDPLIWLAVPFAYFVFAMVRAEIGGLLTSVNSRYPYSFIDVDLLGAGTVARNVLILAAGFCALGYAIVGVDRALGRQNVENG